MVFDPTLVGMDGTGRVTKRNRRFLRPIIPFLLSKATPKPGDKFTPHIQNDAAQSVHNGDISNDVQYYNLGQ